MEVALQPPTSPPFGTLPGPFVGLRRFDLTDSHLFFGRDEQTYELLRRLRLMHFLAVIGPSGCGKSSLIRAGVMAALRDGFLADDGEWRLVMLQPGNGPRQAWIDALRPHTRPGTPDDTLISDPVAALDTTAGPIAILVDQFEELFQFVARTGRRDEAEAFVEAIIRTGAPDARVYAILTMRSEYLAHCAEYPLLADAINSGLHLVSRMTPEQIREAIVQPVHRAGAAITVDLTERLVHEAGREADGLPVLQHALMRMWAARQPFEPVGEGAASKTRLGDFLNEHAEQVYSGLSAAEKNAAEHLFRAITEVSPEGNVVRRAKEFDAIRRERAVDATTLQRVVDAFAQEGFLLVTRSEDGSALIDLSHEAVARQWRRLGSTDPLHEGWVFSESRQERAVQQIERAAKDWIANDRNKDFLFKGLRLQSAGRHVAGRESLLSVDGRQFLAASRTRDERLKWLAPKVLIPSILIAMVVAGLSITLAIQRRDTALEASRAAFAETQLRLQQLEAREAAALGAAPSGATAPANAPANAPTPAPAAAAAPSPSGAAASGVAPPSATPTGAAGAPAAAQPGNDPVTRPPVIATASRPPAALTTAAMALQGRVYVQIRDESQRRTAARLGDALRDAGFLVPGIEVVAVGPSNTELRYLDPAEQAEARRAASVLEAAGEPVSLRLVQLKGQSRARPRHYELWLAPGKAAY